MNAIDASTRGRRNRANGASCERDVARWLRPWWPDACRAVRNTAPDPGDLDCTSPGLWWSVKNCQEERTNAWMAELNDKAGTPGFERVGLLVVRRKGHASPGEWWCWLRVGDLVHLAGDVSSLHADADESPVRMELRHVMPLLVQANYAPTPRSEVA